jgi:hypothetical protein
MARTIYRKPPSASSSLSSLLFALLLLNSGAVSAATYLVTNNSDSASGSLRQAVTDMNSAGVSPSSIQFSISGSKVISLSSALPFIGVSCDFNSTHVSGIVLYGGGVSSGSGVVFNESTAQVSTITGIEIEDFPGNGVAITPANANEIVNVQNCYIHNNGADGVHLEFGSSHHISDASVISANGSFGVEIDPTVSDSQILDSSIQANTLAGVLMFGTQHFVNGCYIVQNGQTEGTGGNNGGVVFGSGSTSASGCVVENCTLAANTPYGAKLVNGADNQLSQNETYLNTTRGIRVISSPAQTAPSLSHFVVDTVNNKVVLKGTVAGVANAQVLIEFFDAIAGDPEGAAFIGSTIVSLDGSGNGNFLVSLDRHHTFQAAALGTGPITFDIDNSDQLVATATDGSGMRGTSEFSAVANATLPGDFNLDGSVDTSDYTIWGDHQHLSGALYTQGDANFNGTVDHDDWVIWAANYGHTP